MSSVRQATEHQEKDGGVSRNHFRIAVNPRADWNRKRLPGADDAIAGRPLDRRTGCAKHALNPVRQADERNEIVLGQQGPRTPARGKAHGSIGLSKVLTIDRNGLLAGSPQEPRRTPVIGRLRRWV